MTMEKRVIYERIANDTLLRYQGRFNELGETPKALGWGGKEDQIERFEVMCQNADFSGKTVMDIGCGFADWYEFMKLKDVNCNYIGVDIIPEFLDICRRKYPDAIFIEGNIMTEGDKLPKADIVITNGTLNFKQKDIDNRIYTRDFISCAYEKANEMIIVDFLSTQLTSTYPREDSVYYHDPKEMLEIAFSFTDDIKLVHNYKPIPQKEAMLFMYKKEVT